jgi:hypothetical protein
LQRLFNFGNVVSQITIRTTDFSLDAALKENCHKLYTFELSIDTIIA